MSLKHYHKLEEKFEKFAEAFVTIAGNSITFILAIIAVIYWISSADFTDIHEGMRDCILAVTFLFFFLVQKTVNKYSKVLHVKLNELVYAHDKASNEMVNIEEKTEKELTELSKNYSGIPKDQSPDKSSR